MAKKVTKKPTPKPRTRNLIVQPDVSSLPTTISTPPKMNPRLLSFALIVLALALLTYKTGPYFVPAMVDGRPLFRFEVWDRLEKSYGTQTLDDLVNEKVLEKAIQIAPVVYSFHKSETLPFLREFTARNGFKITHEWRFQFPLKAAMEHHRRRIHRIEVCCIRLVKQKSEGI